MFFRMLEFRGISLQQLQLYLEELGGTKIALQHPFPIMFKGNHWNASILNEEEIAFTAVFKVNAVHIRFEASQKEVLEDMIRKYRLKTTRIGG